MPGAGPQYYDPAKYTDGTTVRIGALPRLQDFLQTWKLHHKLEHQQLAFAGRVAKVKKSYMYHGGYVLYELEGVPGIWHEQLLESA